MAAPAPRPWASGVVIVGGGLAGGLLALALRERGVAVRLIDAPPAGGVCTATAMSYGAVPGWPLAGTPLARLAAGAARVWGGLERRHGALGWRRPSLRLQGPNPVLGGLSRLGLLPFGQVDTAALERRWPALLAAVGVERIEAAVERLDPQPAGGARLALADGRSLPAADVVLAAGSGCRRLWPALPSRLRSSWAGVLELSTWSAPMGSAPMGLAACWLPQRFARLALERRAAGLAASEWVVDPGLVPRGGGALVGQLTLVRPGLEAGPAPAPAQTEGWLRQALAADSWGAPLADLAGELRQASVAFCAEGGPLVGPVAEGIWAFTGFNAGFSQAPVLAPLLARCLVGTGGGEGESDAALAQADLWRLGVWPTQPRGREAPAGPDLLGG